MTKLLAVALSIVLVFSIAGPAMAKSSDKITEKVNRGGKNIFTAPLEIPKAVIQTTKDSNVIFGILFGPIKGICNMFSKITSGTADIVAAPTGCKDSPCIKPVMVEEKAAKSAPGTK